MTPVKMARGSRPCSTASPAAAIISGFVRGTAVETLHAGISPTENRDRFEEAHDLIVKCWTTPGPFRWEGAVFPAPDGEPLGGAHSEAAPTGVVSRNGQPGERHLGQPSTSTRT